MPKKFHDPHKNPLAPHPTYIIYGPLSCFPLAIKDSVRTSKTRVFEIPKQVTWIAFMWYFAERRIDYMPQQIICIIFGCSAVTFSCKHSYKHLHYPNKGMLNFKKCLTNFVPNDIASFWGTLANGKEKNWGSWFKIFS